jgi:putative oxidoreductase
MTTISATQKKRFNVFHITLWIGQVTVAGMFMMAGSLKTFTPISELSSMIPWAQDNPVLIRFIGVTEIIGAAGLILPAVLKISPRLTVWAACGLTLTMILGTLFHIVRDEFTATPTTIVLGLLSAFIAWGRSTKAPIQAAKRIFDIG